MMKINYKELYKKIIGREPKDKEQLTLFTEYVNDMKNDNKTNPLFYELETLNEYADVRNRQNDLKRILK